MTRSCAVWRLVVRCALLTSIAALPVAFSAWIDPARILGAPHEERAIAQALLAGHNVTDVTNYDDRAIEKLLAAGRTSRPDVLALGSSRIQPLSADAFQGARFVNVGVSGGRLDDILATYALYDDSIRRAKRVVINLDPWTLQHPGADATWSALASERAVMLERLAAPASAWRDRLSLRIAAFKRLASPEYVRLSVFSLRHYGPKGIRFVITTQRENAEKTKTPDGTMVWSRNPPDKTERLVDQYLGGMMDADARYQHLDADVERDRLQLVERFVRYLRASGVEVSFLLVPYHPRAFLAFERRADRPLVWTEERYRALAQRSGARVVGSYDPEKVGMQASDFFDESHLRPEALVRLFRR